MNANDIDWFSQGVAFHYGQYMEDKKLMENKYMRMNESKEDYNNAYKNVG